MTVFAQGQRWISDAETELGMGTILSSDRRSTTILFPVTGATRVYSTGNCPLRRIQFTKGDCIKSHEGWSLCVEDLYEENNLIIYRGLRQDTNKEIALAETEMDHHLQLERPKERLLAGQLDKNKRYSLRYQSLLQTENHQSSHYRGLQGFRGELIPHQLYISHEVGQRYAPRVLLADEVGLGKTIEAGLIIHQQLICEKAQRILILTPESLIHQWFIEMFRRFNLHFSLFDHKYCTSTIDENPFENTQLAICSLDFLQNNPRCYEQLLCAEWDLLVVDEAHHLEWNQNKASPNYKKVERLAEQIPGILLLTATPLQFGLSSHFARLRLLDKNRFYSLERFTKEEENQEYIASLANHLLAEEELSQAVYLELQNLLVKNSCPSLFDLNNGKAKESMRWQLIQRLNDLYGISRIFFRNTRASIKGFPRRIAQSYPLPLPELYQIILQQKTEKSRQLCPELAYGQEALGDDYDPWWKFDPRVNWLVHLISLLKNEKILLIAHNASTALDLYEALRVRIGVPACAFHEGLSLIERDRSAAYFAEELGAQILLCSEIGSEGRNFQFVKHLVLFDLPDNPELLEQRIGRLDRIGQKHNIRIHIPYLQDSAQEVLYRWYAQGLNLFQAINPAAMEVAGLLQSDLDLLLRQKQPSEAKKFALDELLDKSKSLSHKLQEKLSKGRDRLLEINSQGDGQGEQIRQRIQEQDNPDELKTFLNKVFDVIGIETEELDTNSLLIQAGNHMVIPGFPGLPEEGMAITFDRATAIAREDLQLLTWEHPLVDHCLECITSSEFGSTNVALLKNTKIRPGLVLLEGIYRIDLNEAKHLQLKKFLPKQVLRTLIDPQQQDLAEKIPFQAFDSQVEPLKRSTGGKIIKQQQSLIQEQLRAAQQYAQNKADALIAQAIERLKQATDTELDRLISLQQVNPNVRPEEINYLKERAEKGYELLKVAQVRLDCLRIIVTA